MAIIDARGFQLVPDGSGFNSSVGNILNQVISSQLQKKALGGDDDAMASLASADPRRAGAVGGILQNRQAQEQQAQKQAMEAQARQQDMLSRIARGFSTATDKRGFLAAAAEQLRGAGMEDMAAQVQEDLEQYGSNPAVVEQEYGAALEMFGQRERDDTPANLRERDRLLSDLQSKDTNVSDSAKVALGLMGKASGAGMKNVNIGGVPHAFDPRTGGYMPAVVGENTVSTEDVADTRKTIKESESLGTTIGRAEGERQVNAPKAASALRSTFRSVDNVIETAKKAGDQVSAISAGAGGRLLANFSGTKATDLRKTIDTLKAALSFDTLQEMRNNSPTGGALGAISERELDLLGSTVASLDATQSPTQLKENIEKVIDHYNTYRDAAEQAYNSEYGEAEETPEQAPAAKPRMKYNPATGRLE